MASASTRIVIGSVLITVLAACSTGGAPYRGSGAGTSVGGSGSSGTGTGSSGEMRSTDAGPPQIPNEGRNLDDGR